MNNYIYIQLLFYHFKLSIKQLHLHLSIGHNQQMQVTLIRTNPPYSTSFTNVLEQLQSVHVSALFDSLVSIRMDQDLFNQN